MILLSSTSIDMIRKILILGLFLAMLVAFLHQSIFFANYEMQTLMVFVLFLMAFLVGFELQNISKIQILTVFLVFAGIVLASTSLAYIPMGYFYGRGLMLVGLVFVIINTKLILQNSIKIRIGEIVNSVGYIFCIFFIVCYGFIIITKYRQFPINCDRIQFTADRITNLGSNQSFTDIFTKNLSDKLGVSARGLDVDPNSQVGSIISRFDSTKTKFVDRILNDNKTYSMSICEYSISKIQEIFSQPKFIISTIFLIFLLLYPLFRLIVFIFQLLAYVMVYIIFKLNIYKITKTQDRIEKLD